MMTEIIGEKLAEEIKKMFVSPFLS